MTSHTEGTIIVRITTNHLALPLLAGAVALTIAAAPNVSTTQNEEPCFGIAESSQCQRTSNAQTRTAPGPFTAPNSTYGCNVGLNCGCIPHRTCDRRTTRRHNPLTNAIL
jgi:hypothetical protein